MCEKVSKTVLERRDIGPLWEKMLDGTITEEERGLYDDLIRKRFPPFPIQEKLRRRRRRLLNY